MGMLLRRYHSATAPVAITELAQDETLVPAQPVTEEATINIKDRSDAGETVTVLIPQDLTPEAQDEIVDAAMTEVVIDADLLDFDTADLDNKVVEPAPENAEPKKVVTAKKPAAKTKA